MLKNLFIFIISIILFCSSQAHQGGHYNENDIHQLHRWNIHGQKLIGNIMLSKDNFVVIEGIHGKLFRIPYSEISEKNDLSYTNREIKRMDEINKENKHINEPSLNFVLYITSILCLITSIYFFNVGIRYMKKNNLLLYKATYSMLAITFLLLSIISCKKSNIIENNPIIHQIPKTSAAFIDSAFSPYKPSITTSWDSSYFHIGATGFPNHNRMIGITNWQQQVPIPQNYTGSNSWSIPLQPVYAEIPLSTKTNFMKGAIAIAANGIPIFNALNNRGEDSYLIGELDQWGGHCGKGDDYHYHAAPLHLGSTSGLLPIAFGLDGFAVYGTKEPDGSNMSALDTCHGHIGTNGIYHYHGTTNYPYVIGAMKGKVTTDPTTPAPENQILPQAYASPLRPATSPLRNATITDYSQIGNNHYLLTYQIANKFGYVEYSWNASNFYTFILTDTSGRSITNTYQR